MTPDDSLAYLMAVDSLNQDIEPAKRPVPWWGQESDTSPETPDESTNQWRREARDTGESGA